MPLMRNATIWPTRVAWPRQDVGRIPALATAGPSVRAYVAGKSRWALSPLRLTLDQLLFLITAALLAIGIVMVQSAEARVGVGASSSIWGALTGGGGAGGGLNKNMMHAAIALAVMTFLWRLDYRRLGGRPAADGQRPWLHLLLSPAVVLVLTTCVLLVLVLKTPLGQEKNGARRWLALGPLGFQPSELAKLGLVLFLSACALHLGEGVRRFWRGFVPMVAAFGIVALLVVKEDFGTTVLVVTVCFVLLAMAGCRWWHLLMLLPPAGAGAYMMLHDPWRMKRIMAFMNPMADPKGAGYHPMQSLLTIMSGGFWGRGLGNGIQKMGYLPEDNTDFIFAVICEELGIFGALMVVALFVILVIVGWRIAARCNHIFGKMVAFGITAIIGLQAAINIAVVTVSMPTKGIALPFISSGGTGWIMMAAAVGVLMSIERINQKERAGSAALPAYPVGFGFPVVLGKAPAAAVGPTTAAPVVEAPKARPLASAVLGAA